MPKLHLSIHIDQHGLQTINSDGDPSLWPLVGRLAACHSQVKTLTLFAMLDSGGSHQAPAAANLVLRGVAEDGDAHQRAAAVEADPLARGGIAGRVVVLDHEGAGDVVGAGPVDRGDLEAARVDDLAGGPVARPAATPALGPVNVHRRALKS